MTVQEDEVPVVRRLRAEQHARRRRRRRWRNVAMTVVVALLVMAGVYVVADDDEVISAAATSTPSTASTSTTASTTTMTSTTAVPPTVATPPPTTVPATAPPTTAPPVDPRCRPPATLRGRAAAVVMTGVDPSGIAEAERLSSGDAPVGGIFIGGDATGIFRNGDLRRLVERRPLLVAVDDEGGRVQRLERLAGDLPSAREQSAWSTERLRSMAAERAAHLRRAGVTVNFAPVADVTTQGDREIIGDRSFGADVNSVVRAAGAVAAGYRESGVMPTLKHFPGHGRGRGDSHDQPVETPTLSDLERTDLVPYRELLDDGPAWVMTGHLDTPGLTEPGVPASLSASTYRYLRRQLDFHGVVVTDELGGMRAVSSRYPPGEAAVRALAAGADLVLFADPRVVPAVVDSIVAAVSGERIPAARLDEAVMRVRAAAGC